MFDVGFGEIVFLLILALLVLGPEKLPKFAADAGRFVRTIRQLATQARTEVRDSLGPEFSQLAEMDVKDLNPRRLAQRHLLDDESPAERRERRERAGASNGSGATRAEGDGWGATGATPGSGPKPTHNGNGRRAEPAGSADPSRPPYDADAT